MCADGRAAARTNGVVFADGTTWFEGLLHVADPKNPLRWNVVGKSRHRAYSKYASPFVMKASYGASGAAALRYSVPVDSAAPCGPEAGLLK